MSGVPTTGMRTIGVDAHVLTGKRQGSRVWLEGVLSQVGRIDPRNRWIIYSNDPGITSARFPFANFVHKPVPGERAVPRLLAGWPRARQQDGLDVLVTQYIAPPFYAGRQVVVVHDLLFEFASPSLSARLPLAQPPSGAALRPAGRGRALALRVHPLRARRPLRPAAEPHPRRAERQADPAPEKPGRGKRDADALARRRRDAPLRAGGGADRAAKEHRPAARSVASARPARRAPRGRREGGLSARNARCARFGRPRASSTWSTCPRRICGRCTGMRGRLCFRARRKASASRSWRRWRPERRSFTRTPRRCPKSGDPSRGPSTRPPPTGSGCSRR